MGLEIKYTCNICNRIYIRNDGKITLPLGWGSIKPTLRIMIPNWREDLTKKEHGVWASRKKLYQQLKDKLVERIYYICPDCLELSQGDIIKIETNKKVV